MARCHRMTAAVQWHRHMCICSLPASVSCLSTAGICGQIEQSEPVPRRPPASAYCALRLFSGERVPLHRRFIESTFRKSGGVNDSSSHTCSTITNRRQVVGPHCLHNTTPGGHHEPRYLHVTTRSKRSRCRHAVQVLRFADHGLSQPSAIGFS